MTHFLCTVGTSASQDIMRNETFLRTHLSDAKGARLDAKLVEKMGGVEAAIEKMKVYFLALDWKDEATLRRKLPAEIHSLRRMGAGDQDRVVLFATDTPDGQVCARLVQTYLVERLGMHRDNVPMKIIEGMQVDDGARFRREGVVNYIQAVRAEGDQLGWHDVVLNPTGGFKALIPYTTLMGMLFRVPVRYIFDNGSEIIELPQFPIEFDLPRLLPILPRLVELEEKTVMTQDSFWRGTPHHDRSALEGLVEQADRPGWVTLSGLGLIALERLQQKKDHVAIRIAISLKAWEDLHNASAEWGVWGQLETLAASTRQQVLERFEDRQGAEWFKPGNTSDRWRAEFDGETLLILRVVSHQEYERILSARRRLERHSHEPFIPYAGPPV